MFQDGAVWIVLFARLDCKGEFAAQARLMQALKGRIAVPEVYAFSDSKIDLGARYMLMEGICGNRAEAEYLMFGIPDRHWNQVLDQLGAIMAQGMAVTWKHFKVNGKEYERDSDFWIQPSEIKILRAVNEINQHKDVFISGRYSTFVEHLYFHLKALFAELLYLANDFLHPKKRPSEKSQCFPANLPPLTMENVIFDEEYNVKAIVGFPQSESISTWDYFQYPLGLEDPFEEHPMTRTITWMRESFVEAWRRELEVLNLTEWDAMPAREKWARKDDIATLYEFRTTTEHTSKLLNQMLCTLYHLDKSLTADLMFEAFIFALCSFLAHNSAAWTGKVDFYIDLFTVLAKQSTQVLHQLAEQGRYVSLRLMDQRPFPTFPR